MGLSDNIKYFRKLRGLEVEELADKIGATSQSVYDWEDNGITPRKKYLDKLVEVLGVTLSELHSEEIERKPTSERKPHRPTIDKSLIPFYDTVASAGYSMEVNEDPVTGPTELIHPGSWFKGADAAMRVTGDSMFPKYRAGAVVALRRIFDLKNEILWGEDYVVEMQENRVLKAVHESAKGDEYIDLVSLNPGADSKGRAKNPSKTYPLSLVRKIYKVIGKFDYETGAGGVFIIKERQAQEI